MRKLFETPNDWLLAVVRVVLAVVIWPHGAQKVLGLFGGGGYEATMAGMSKNLPAFLVLLVMAAEFLGGFGFLLGFLGRFCAFGMICVMLGAILTVHAKQGLFFMNWMGNQGGEGIEYHLLFIGLALVTLVRGSGAWSVDRWIAGWLAKPKEQPEIGVRASGVPV